MREELKCQDVVVELVEDMVINTIVEDVATDVVIEILSNTNFEVEYKESLNIDIKNLQNLSLQIKSVVSFLKFSSTALPWTENIEKATRKMLFKFIMIDFFSLFIFIIVFEN